MGRTPEEVLTVYALYNGALRETGAAAFMGYYKRTTREPVSRKDGFSAAVRDGQLILLTGQNGDGIVSSAEIRLNGTLVAGPQHFNGQKRSITIPVKLAAENVIETKLAGAPNDGLWVIVK